MTWRGSGSPTGLDRRWPPLVVLGGTGVATAVWLYLGVVQGPPPWWIRVGEWALVIFDCGWLVLALTWSRLLWDALRRSHPPWGWVVPIAIAVVLTASLFFIQAWCWFMPIY